jgi:hypothetical protein
MKYINWLRTVRRFALNKIKRKRYNSEMEGASKLKNIVDVVQKEGFFVYENFFSAADCALFKKEFDLILEKNEQKIWRDSEGADARCYGIDRISPVIKEQFYGHPDIVALRELFLLQKDENIEGFTMSNRIVPTEGNLGSGGGWHRDTVNERQLKVILYLTDVKEKNGPFQYLRGTQDKKSVLEGILNYNFEYNHNRFKEEDISTYLDTGDYELSTLTGKAGTLIIVDTSGIHRGMPIEEGERYALTNYYYLSQKIGGKTLLKKMADLLNEKPAVV